MRFEKAQEENERFASHLECWRRYPYAGRLVRHDGALWFVKSGYEKHPGARERDRLGYLLGRDLANVAEVRCVDADGLDALRAMDMDLHPYVHPEHVWLSRFAPDYAGTPLRCASLEHAMAAELVYSLWIRRRDAHAFNRSFVEGLPIFFDHETAFLGEPDLVHAERFFREGPNPGYAGLWRIAVDPRPVLDTPERRRRERARFEDARPHPVRLPVRDRERFWRALDAARDAIAPIRRRTIAARVEEAGFRAAEARSITAFLRRGQTKLAREVERLKELLLAPIPAPAGGPVPSRLRRLAARVPLTLGRRAGRSASGASRV